MLRAVWLALLGLSAVYGAGLLLAALGELLRALERRPLSGGNGTRPHA